MKKYWLLPICLLLIFSLLGCNAEDDDDDDSDSRRRRRDFSSSYATPNDEDDFEWEYTNDGLVITRYVGDSTTVVVPETIENKKVISVGNTFIGNVVIESIVLPETISELDLRKFADCDSLKRIEALGATSVHEYPLNITELVLPKLKDISGHDYYSCDVIFDCAQLEYLYIPNAVCIETVSTGEIIPWPESLKEVVISEDIDIIRVFDDDYCIEDAGRKFDPIGTLLVKDIIGDSFIINGSLDDSFIEINDENRAYVYCHFFQKESIIVNGVTYELEE